jgi:hypothetical protein
MARRFRSAADGMRDVDAAAIAEFGANGQQTGCAT